MKGNNFATNKTFVTLSLWFSGQCGRRVCEKRITSRRLGDTDISVTNSELLRMPEPDLHKNEPFTNQSCRISLGVPYSSPLY